MEKELNGEASSTGQSFVPLLSQKTGRFGTTEEG